MIITPKRLIDGSILTDAWATYYTVPSNVISATAKQMVVCNTDSSTRTFSYAVVKIGDTQGAKNTMFNAVTLQANESKVFGLTDVMHTGYFIQAKADTASKVSLTVSGMENT